MHLIFIYILSSFVHTVFRKKDISGFFVSFQQHYITSRRVRASPAACTALLLNNIIRQKEKEKATNPSACEPVVTPGHQPKLATLAISKKKKGSHAN